MVVIAVYQKNLSFGKCPGFWLSCHKRMSNILCVGQCLSLSLWEASRGSSASPAHFCPTSPFLFIAGASPNLMRDFSSTELRVGRTGAKENSNRLDPPSPLLFSWTTPIAVSHQNLKLCWVASSRLPPPLTDRQICMPKPQGPQLSTTGPLYFIPRNLQHRQGESEQRSVRP